MNNLKKFLGVIAFWGLSWGAANAQTVIDGGNCGSMNQISWQITNDSVLTLGGSGEMDEGFAWITYRSVIKTVIIGNSITSISDSAFLDCENLTSVTIGSSVASIGERTFCRCVRLQSISIPNSVTTINAYAFGGCSGLTSITIPENVSDIGNYAFNGCNGLKTVNYNAINCTAGSYPFYYTGFTTLNIGNQVQYLANDLFAYCGDSLAVVTIPESVTTIGAYTFMHCHGLHTLNFNAEECYFMGYSGNPAFFACTSFTTVNIGSNVKIIPSNGFIGCEGLTSIVIPNSVTSIGNKAFQNCQNLVSVTLGNSVSDIGDYAFENCNQLDSIVFPNSVQTIGTGAFRACSNIKTANFGKSLKTIGESAFTICNALTSITIPDSVTSIGSNAFQSCIGLHTVNFNAINGETMGSNIFYNTALTTLNIGSQVNAIPNKAFQSCSGLTSIVFPNNLKTIGSYAFYGCSNLDSITLGSGIAQIGEHAFAFCSALRSVTIPDSITIIENYAFAECSHLHTVNFNAINCSTMGGTAFYGDTLLATVNIGNKVKNIPANAFSERSGLTSLTIPASVETIGNNAFYNCTGLTAINSLPTTPPAASAGTFTNVPNNINVYVPCQSLSAYKAATRWSSFTNYISIAKDTSNTTGTLSWRYNFCDSTLTFSGKGNMPNYSITNFPWYAYKDAIKTVIIGDSVAVIGNYAFSNCSNLTAVTIPSSVTSIGGNAFQNCISLGSVTISNSVTSIGTAAFSGCSSLSSVTIPNGVTSIGAYAFQNCSSLSSVTISNSVTSIGTTAFSGCKSLVSITVPSSVTTIGAIAFAECDELISINIDTNNPNYSSIDGILYNKIQDTLFQCPAGKITATVPNSVITIVSGAFYRCEKLTSVTIPNGVINLVGNTFWYCSKLTSIDIPNSVTNIGSNAFQGCNSLTSVTFGTGIANIGTMAFNACSKITVITCKAVDPPVMGSNVFPTTTKSIPVYVPCQSIQSYKDSLQWKDFTNYKALLETGSAGNLTWTFHPCDSVLTLSGSGAMPDYYVYGTPWYPVQDAIKTVIIGDSVTCLGDYAFSHCENLSTVSIGKNVKNIKENAFSFCYSLKTITIPDSVTAIGQYVFYNCTDLKTVNFNAVNCSAMNDNTFSGCSSLNSVSIGQGVTSIPSSIFAYCSQIRSVTLPMSLKTIGSSAFYLCTGLTTITIPDSVTTIDNFAFQSCYNLKTVNFNAVNCGAMSNNSVFYGDTLFTILNIGNRVKTIPVNAFSGCSKIDSVTIPESVTTIGNNAFWNCTALQSITSKAITPPTLGGSAFYNVSTTIPVTVPCLSVSAYKDSLGWSSFTNYISISDTVGTAGTLTWAWSACDSTLRINGNGIMPNYLSTPTPWSNYKNVIKTVIIGDGVTSIGTRAFDSCENLSSVNFPQGITRIGTSAFNVCTSLTSIFLPNSLKSIENAAFYGCKNLDTAAFGNDITTIEQHAFNGCTSLRYVTLGDSLTSLGNYAFDACSSLKSVTFGDNLASIGKLAFYSCGSLTTVTIGSSVASIGERAFNSCDNLQSINVNAGNLNYASENGVLFNKAKTILIQYPNSKADTNYSMPSSVTSIENSAFYACTKLKSVTISDNVASIGDYAFTQCNKLTSIASEPTTPPTLGTNVFSSVPKTISVYVPCQSIQSYKDSLQWQDFTNYKALPDTVGTTGTLTWSFTLCDSTLRISGKGDIPNYSNGEMPWYNYKDAIKTVIIGDSVTRIGTYAFADCIALTSVAISNSATSIGTCAFYTCSKLDSIVIPNKVSSIASSAFWNCSSLKSVTFGDSLKSIGNYAFLYCSSLTVISISNNITNIGSSAFHYCSSLISFDVDANNADYTSENGVLFDKAKTRLIQYPAGRADTNYIIPSTVATIEQYAFYDGGKLKSVTIPAGVATIGNYAFQNCNKLTSITSKAIIPPTLGGTSVFNSVPKSIPVYVPCLSIQTYKDSLQWQNFTNYKAIPDTVGAAGTLTWSFTLCDSTLRIYGNGIMPGYLSTSTPWIKYKNVIKTVIISDSVTSIGNRVFDSCIYLTSVTMGNSVTSIGNTAFLNCINLTSVTLGNNVATIGYSAFHNCKNLTTLNLPNSVTSIGSQAFSNCTSLTALTIGSNMTSIEAAAFVNCTSLTAINVDINNLSYCSENGVLFDKAKTILIQYPVGKADTSYTIPGSVTSLEMYAFYNGKNLKSITIPNGVVTIGNFVFVNCNQLTSITLPGNLASIGTRTFEGCSSLTSITSRAVTPPTLQGSVFNTIPYSTIPVYVPCGSIQSYKDSVEWNNFNNYREEFADTTLVFDTTCAGMTYNDHGFSGITTAGTYYLNLQNSQGCDSLVVLTLTVHPVKNDTITATICSSDTYTQYGFNANSAGTHIQNLTTVNGCDSIVTLLLTVHPVKNDTITAAICSGDTYTQYSFNANSAGTHIQNLTTVNGCDSIVTLLLTVHPVKKDTITAAICSGDTYTQYGFNANSAGTHIQNLTTVNGCDSIVTLLLTVHPVKNDTITAAICSGNTYTQYGFNANSAGTHIQNLTTVNGCDSIVTLLLTVHPVKKDTITAAICSGDTYTQYGFNANSAGTHIQNLTTVNGCDSIVTLLLTVHPVKKDTITAAICSGYTYTQYGFNANSAGTHIQNLTTVNGCDSIVTLLLTVHPVKKDTITAAICSGDTYTQYGFNANSTGTHIQNLTTVNGCDSIVTLLLTVHAPIPLTKYADTLCFGEIYNDANFSNLSVADVYYDTLKNVNNCDSVIEFSLSYYPAVAITQYASTICQGGFYTDNNFINLTLAGTYYDTLKNINGCDSVIEFTLSYYPAIAITQYASTICQGGFYTDNNFTNLTLAGTYYDTLNNINGCDSVIEFTLSYYPAIAITQYASTICQGGFYTDNNFTNLTLAGTYYDTLKNVNGCDSVIEFALSYFPSVAITQYASTICQGGFYTDNNFTNLTLAGTYYDTLKNVNGCDSVIEFALSYFPSVAITQYADTICHDEVYNDAHFTNLTLAGVYYDTLTNVNGCDSIVSLLLTVNYCTAEISGIVRYQNHALVHSGTVNLYLAQNGIKHLLIDTAVIANNGTYLFTGVSNGDYVIKVIPDSANVVATYYGNTEHWDSSTFVTIAKHISIDTVDITLLQALPPLTGNCLISGYVGMEEGSSQAKISQKGIGEPVVDESVTLQRQISADLWKTVAVTLTDKNGYFEFRNVPSGTYKVTLDIPGLKHYDPETFDLDEGDSVIDIEYEITEDSIINKSGGEVGIVLLQGDKVAKLHVYPNPTNYQLKITNYELKENTVIEIYNVVGQKVGAYPCGRPETTINVQHLPNGMYYIKVNERVSKFVKMSD